VDLGGGALDKQTRGVTTESQRALSKKSSVCGQGARGPLTFKEQKVEVATVNVVNVKGKEKRHGRFIGRRKNLKKAYVRLKGEGDINFVEGVA